MGYQECSNRLQLTLWGFEEGKYLLEIATVIYDLHCLHFQGNSIICPLVEGVVLELDIEERGVRQKVEVLGSKLGDVGLEMEFGESFMRMISG